MTYFKTAATLALVALSTPVFADSFSEIKVEAGEKLFDAECHRCHADNPTDPSYGPPLVNVVGRGAGPLRITTTPPLWQPLALSGPLPRCGRGWRTTAALCRGRKCVTWVSPILSFRTLSCPTCRASRPKITLPSASNPFACGPHGLGSRA